MEIRGEVSRKSAVVREGIQTRSRTGDIFPDINPSGMVWERSWARIPLAVAGTNGRETEREREGERQSERDRARRERGRETEREREGEKERRREVGKGGKPTRRVRGQPLIRAPSNHFLSSYAVDDTRGVEERPQHRKGYFRLERGQGWFRCRGPDANAASGRGCSRCGPGLENNSGLVNRRCVTMSAKCCR